MRTITRTEAARFYDKFGAKQDRQGFYEDPALNLMIELGSFPDAENVFELGCGTGKLAEQLLSAHLPPLAHYVGVDVSSVMVNLAEERLARFDGQVEVHLSDGDFDFSRFDGPFDRIVSTYVLDLLSLSDIEEFLAGAHAALSGDGLLCHTGLTEGTGPISKATSTVWTWLNRINPMLVGGCRPLTLVDHIPGNQWEIVHREVAVGKGIPSEVVILKARYSST